MLFSLMIALNIDNQWTYGLKTKDELIDVVKLWYTKIADQSRIFGENINCLLMRDIPGENMTQEIQEFFTDKGVRSYFATPYEP